MFTFEKEPAEAPTLGQVFVFPTRLGEKPDTLGRRGYTALWCRSRPRAQCFFCRGEELAVVSRWRGLP